MKSSHRDLFNDMAEHWYILKNNRNMYNTLVLFAHPKHVRTSQNRCFVFTEQFRTDIKTLYRSRWENRWVTPLRVEILMLTLVFNGHGS